MVGTSLLLLSAIVGPVSALVAAPLLRVGVGSVRLVSRPRAAVSLSGRPPSPHCFDVDTAVLLAGFAFEAYNEPDDSDARWERGADGTEVAFISDEFAAECYQGRLEVCVQEVRDLPPPKQLNLNDPVRLLTGGNVDPYLVLALNEEATDISEEGAAGLKRATDVARTSTRWSSEQPRGTPRGAAMWPDGGERLFLYVRRPEDAQLALTVFDEDVFKDDEKVGAASVPIATLLGGFGGEGGGVGAGEVREWSGWIPLSWRPKETKDNAVLAGAVAGAFVAGPLGAAAGGVLANTFLKKEVQGEVKVTLKYTPLERPREQRWEFGARKAVSAPDPDEVEEETPDAAGDGAAETEASEIGAVEIGAPEKGASETEASEDEAAPSRRGWLGRLGKGESNRMRLLRVEMQMLRERLAKDKEMDEAAKEEEAGWAWAESEDGKEGEANATATGSLPGTAAGTEMAAAPEPLNDAEKAADAIKGADAETDPDAAEWVAPRLTSKGLPRGASEGVDWSELTKRVGSLGVDEGGAFELCCYVDHTPSSTQAAMWRDRGSRRIVVSFRGTSDVTDVLTDVNLLQTPFEQRSDGKPSDDPRLVHNGFFTSACAVNRRLKELLVAACAGTPGEWEVLVTGHSLGGALATLFIPELASGVDASRGFKQRADTSWFGRLADMRTTYWNRKKGGKRAQEAVRLGKVRLYTFGAPRVGNSEFARDFDAMGIEAYRIVNGEDIVPRLPRHANSAGAFLNYEHVGRTVLVDEAGGVSGGFWVEGESDEKMCPLRDVSPLTNPFGPGTFLTDIAAAFNGVEAQPQTGDGEKTKGGAAAAAIEARLMRLREADRGGEAVPAGAVQQKMETLEGSMKGEELEQLKDLQAQFQTMATQLGRARDDISKRLGALTPAEAMAMIGLEARFVEQEVRMMQSMRKGTFVAHHLEPSYFAAMRRALDQHLKSRWARELGES